MQIYPVGTNFKKNFKILKLKILINGWFERARVRASPNLTSWGKICGQFLSLGLKLVLLYMI